MDAQKGPRSLRIILQKVPDKKAEAAVVHLLTEKLHVMGDDAAKVVRAVPIILFDELTVKEAEQINLFLKQLGARSAISNDPNDAKKFPRVHWPRKIDLDTLAKLEPEKPAPLLSAPLRPPAAPVAAPPPSFTASQEWKTKYDLLEKSYLAAMDRLKTRETELKNLQEQLGKLKKPEEILPPLEMKIRSLSEEKERLARERAEIQTRAETLAHEKDRVAQTFHESQRTLEEKVRTLAEERERLAKEHREMQSRTESFERQLGQFQDLNFLLEKPDPLGELEKTREQLRNQLEALAKRKEELKSQLALLENVLTPYAASAKAQK
jgi:uncharacterized phage infection (PIP) family protein YhgE